MVSGNAMLKNLLSGSLYLSLTTFFDTFLTTSDLVYSPPGTQFAAHSNPSPQSTPKRRMRSARVSGSGLSARRERTTDEALPAGHDAGSPPRTPLACMELTCATNTEPITSDCRNQAVQGGTVPTVATVRYKTYRYRRNLPLVSQVGTVIER